MRNWIKSFWVVFVFLILYSLFSLPTAQAQSPTPTKTVPSTTKPLPPNAKLPSAKPAASVNRSPRLLRATSSCGGSSRTSLPGNAVIVDDQSAQFHRNGPSQYWNDVSGSTSDYYNGHMVWTYNEQSGVVNWAQWDAPVVAGIYEVWAFIPRYYATTTSAWYTIDHAGQSSTCILNQNIYYAVWVSLGIYQFGSGSGNDIKLDDWTGEANSSTMVGFDAVAFVPTTFKAYLPLIMKPLPSKAKTGIHLGNRNSDWTMGMLTPFDPRISQTPPGAWPAIIVAQSNQVFNINRSTSPPDCKITNVTVKNQNAYNLLQDSARLGGTKVVIRIMPSPGNFAESIQSGWLSDDPNLYIRGRTLLTDTNTRPGNWYQCDNDWRFRTVADIGDEMLAIQQFANNQGWTVWGFEPANEPNTEWYTSGKDKYGNPLPQPIPSNFNAASWQAIDQYFANIYSYVHANAGSLSIRVLTPPMAQNAYAEKKNTLDCSYFYLDNGVNGGYQVMSQTFNSTNPMNDGYSWHNYWAFGHEGWLPCEGHYDDGQHVSRFFPSPMYYVVSPIDWASRPGVITEADLASPGQGFGSSLTDKDGSYVSTDVSIRDFISSEQLAQQVTVWLLNDNTNSTQGEHEWHEAYSSGFRTWFQEWWPKSQ